MSEPVLSRVSDLMAKQVEDGLITGAVTALALHGEVVHFDAHGYSVLEDKTPMPRDAIFRMASSTKPVIGVAVMQQIEQGQPGERRNLRIIVGGHPLLEHLSRRRGVAACIQQRGVLEYGT